MPIGLPCRWCCFYDYRRLQRISATGAVGRMAGTFVSGARQGTLSIRTILSALYDSRMTCHVASTIVAFLPAVRSAALTNGLTVAALKTVG